MPIQEDDVDAWLDPNSNDLPSMYAILDRRVRPYYEHQLVPGHFADTEQMSKLLTTPETP